MTASYYTHIYTLRTVVFAGFGRASGSHWKVRNSWGTSFGENGFLRIKMGGNLCNLNSEPTKTTVSASVGNYTA